MAVEIISMITSLAVESNKLNLIYALSTVCYKGSSNRRGRPFNLNETRLRIG